MFDALEQRTLIWPSFRKVRLDLPKPVMPMNRNSAPSEAGSYVVVSAAHQVELREVGLDAQPRAVSPTRLSPFDVFRGYASAILTVNIFVTVRDAALLEASLLDESTGLRAVAALVMARLEGEAMPLGALHDRCGDVSRGG